MCVIGLVTNVANTVSYKLQQNKIAKVLEFISHFRRSLPIEFMHDSCKLFLCCL